MTDIRDEPGFNPNQHCTFDGPGDLTFTHTAAYCGNPQPRRCPCPFDYPEPEPMPNGTLVVDENGLYWVYLPKLGPNNPFFPVTIDDRHDFGVDLDGRGISYNSADL